MYCHKLLKLLTTFTYFKTKNCIYLHQ